MNTLVVVALTYADRGWRILPLGPGAKQPLLNGWPVKATTNHQQIRYWWQQYPDANVGIATGQASNLVVLDIDHPQAFVQWQEACCLELRTATVGTGRGGRHYYFRPPTNVHLGNRTRFLPGADLRGDGGYVVAPPSCHPNGTHYAWHLIVEGDLPPLPQSILEAALTNSIRRPRSSTTLSLDSQLPHEKLHALLRDPKFRASWERTRTDIRDTSPSGWDMSLATRAARAGWAGQEIAALLIASRRKHGDRIKRPDYFQRTITRALHSTAGRARDHREDNDG